MSQYATEEQVKRLGILLPEEIEFVEARYPGITLETIVAVSADFDSKLIKRYAAPFQEPYPDALIDKVCQVVAFRLLRKRGVNQESPQYQDAKDEHDKAIAWRDEAADSEDGLIELPKRQDVPFGTGAVSKGAPLFYSEQSPYTWARNQAIAARAERSR